MVSGFDTEHARGDIAEARDLIVAMAVRLPLKYRDHEPTLVLFDELAALRERVAGLQGQLEATRQLLSGAKEALAAYRSALLCGEPEPDSLRKLGDWVLAGRGVREPGQETR